MGLGDTLTPADRRRRRIGALLLGTAVLMVVAGLSRWIPGLEGLRYLLYWLVCYVLTALSILIAILDIAVMRRRLDRERDRLWNEASGSLGGTNRNSGDGTDPRP